MRAYVKETEANPQFVAWSSNDLNPTFKQTQFRSTQATPLHSKTPSLPSPPRSANDPVKVTPRYGRGALPCYCCGSDQHRWNVFPSRNRRGKCEVCGKDNHLTYTCVRRFRPDPSLVKAAPPPRPVSFRATHAQPFTSIKHDPMPASPPAHETTAALRWAKANDAPKELAALPHKLPDTELTPQPAWIRSMLSHHTQPRKLMEGQPPVNNPSADGTLLHQIKLDGRSTTALLYNGASHSFVSIDWADSEQRLSRLKPIPLREPHRIINFGGMPRNTQSVTIR